MAAFVSLFRGINVGGNQKVRMAELKALHEELGFAQVATYLQTGNVVFTGDHVNLVELAERIESGFAQKFGFRVMVTVRTPEQIDAMVQRNPFSEQTIQKPKWVVALFLATLPTSSAQEDLQQVYAGPEIFHIIGQEMYIYYPEGMGRSKLTSALLEKKLQTRGTGRNWNTVLELQKMLHLL